MGLLAQQDDSIFRTIFQLVLVAIFLLGPLLARGLQKLAGQAQERERRSGGGSSQGRGQEQRGPRRSDAEELGGDLWRQLMELEQEQPPARERTASAGEAAAPEAAPVPPPRPQRRPADPLGDPDVELAQNEALERRRRRQEEQRREAEQRRRRAERRARAERTPPPSEGQFERAAPLERFESPFASVPSEDRAEALAMEGTGIGTPTVAPSAGPMFAGIAAPMALAGAAGRGRVGPISRRELRRAVVLSEVLGPPVGDRRGGVGGRGV